MKVDLSKGCRFRNVSTSVVALTCPKRGPLKLKGGEVLDLLDDTQKDVDRFQELGRAIRLGLLIQEELKASVYEPEKVEGDRPRKKKRSEESEPEPVDDPVG